MYGVRYKSHHDASRALKEKFRVGVSGEEYVRRTLSSPARSRRAIYIHVPFCNKICSFCPFHRPDALRRRTYHELLIPEISRVSAFPYMEAPVESVYFGGGTPTALLPEQMAAILTALHTRFNIAADAEISVETSASELTDAMLEKLVVGGVNRLSVGIQTFDDKGRALLGRRGSGERAAGRLRRALEFGIRNTNIDLIYNYPGQTFADLEEDLRVIRELGIAGLSFYSLMIHEKTPLAARLTDRERQIMADTDREMLLFQTILRGLAPAGFVPLELTKLVRDGIDSYDYMFVRHTGGSCIALGHGAGGNLEEYLYHNSYAVPTLSEDLPISARGRVVSPLYRKIDEFIFAWQQARIDLDRYSVLLELPLHELFAPELTRLAADGLIEYEASLGYAGDTVGNSGCSADLAGISTTNARTTVSATNGNGGGIIRLTEAGIFWGNNIIDELVRKLIDAVASPA